MKYTANTKLNQWEKSDRIMMSDFNSDNQKLDAALLKLTKEDTAIRQAYTREDAALRQSVAALQTQLDTLTARTVPFLLKEVTLSQGGNPLLLDLSFIDWDLYDRIIIESRLATDGNDPYVKVMESPVGRLICRAYAKNVYASASTVPPINRLTLYSHGDKERSLYAEAISFTNDDTRQLINIKGTELKGLKMTGTDGKTGMAAGCWFRITGVKA